MKTKQGLGSMEIVLEVAVFAILLIILFLQGSSYADKITQDNNENVSIVAVVDDDEIMRNGIEEALPLFTEHNIVVMTFASGAEASEYEGQVEVAIIDGLKPREYGPDVASSLAIRWRASIICHSSDQWDVLKECKRRGFDAVDKAIGIVQLAGKVDQLLTQRGK